MANIKHVGRLKTNKRRLVVPYRTIPNDPHSCLVVFIDTLASDEHDSLMKVVESAAGQQAYELAEVMNRSFLADGRNMLLSFHKTGKLQKMTTTDVELVPNVNSSMLLSELNEMIASQRGVSLEDLSLASDTAPAKPATVAPVAEAVATPAEVAAEAVAVAAEAAPLTDEDLARKYRSDADRMSKEAAALRRMAEDLVPTKKKSAKKTESA